jgi:hypothetical protein
MKLLYSLLSAWYDLENFLLKVDANVPKNYLLDFLFIFADGEISLNLFTPVLREDFPVL